MQFSPLSFKNSSIFLLSQGFYILAQILRISKELIVLFAKNTVNYIYGKTNKFFFTEYLIDIKQQTIIRQGAYISR